jgi:hypothetical protein
MEATVTRPAESQFLRRYGAWLALVLVILVAVVSGYITNPRITRAVLSATLRQSTPLVLGSEHSGFWPHRLLLPDRADDGR